MGEFQIKRSGTKNLLQKLSELYEKNICYNIDCDVSSVDGGYVVKSTVKTNGKSYCSVCGTKDITRIHETYLDSLYQTLMISGLFTTNLCMVDKNTKDACKDAQLIALDKVDSIKETDLQHIVMNHVTKLGKDFKKVFENYKVSEPCMLTPAICKKYLKSEIRKGVEVSF